MAGVDWQAFATAFLGDTAKYINERKDKAEEYEQKQRDLAERNSAVLRQRQGIVDQVGGLANRAMNELGATEEMVKAAIDSGPQGIQTLVQQLQDTKTSMGTRWTPEAAQAAITLPTGYTSAPGLSLDEYVRQAYGLPAATTGSYAAPESSWWDRAMGRNATDAARQRLDQEVAAGGYSIYDINELASQAEYQSLVGGAYVNFVAPKVFNRENIDSELTFINNLVTDAANSPAVTTMQAELERQQDIVSSGAPQEERDAAKLEVARLTADINNFTQGRVRTAMMDRFGYYTAGGYMELMAPHIDQLLGQEGFTSQAYADFQDMMGLSQPTTEAPSPVAQTQAPELGDVAASIEASGGTAVVEGSNLVVQSDVLRDALGSDDGKATISYDDAGQPTAFMFTMNGEEFIIDNPDDVAELVNTVAAVDTTPATARTGYSQPNLPDIAPEDMPIVPRQLISEEDSAAMTREQRRALGLKESPLGRLLEFLPSEEERNRRLDQLDIKYSANPDEYYLVTIPGRAAGPYRVKGENLQYIPDAVLARGNDNATIETMDTLDGTGRPPRILTSHQLLSIYNPASFTAPENRPPERMTEEQMAEFEIAKQELQSPAPKEPIPADDTTEALLSSHGGVMINYLKDQGLNAESSPEELTIALMNFQQETGTQLPFDKGALVQILTQAMAEGY